jgi:hypothetical protein
MAEFPPALDIVRAMSALLASRLEDAGARRITLTRDEAALCLGLIDALVEILEREAPPDR